MGKDTLAARIACALLATSLPLAGLQAAGASPGKPADTAAPAPGAAAAGADANGADSTAAANGEPQLSPEVVAFLEKVKALKWTRGPASVAMQGNASLALPEHFGYLDTGETDKYLTLTQNLPSGTEVLVAPRTLAWTAYLSFDDEGYVKDDEKIDAAKLLQTLKDDAEASNEERRKRGFSALHVIDWAVPPAYNPQTRRLEWATLVQTDSGRNINFFTKILGRRGYTTVILVSDVDTLSQSRAELNQLLTSFAYNSGDQYADYKPGDKVAEYGLAALILGGAAAIATKKGFWAILASFFAAAWKFLAVGVAAAGAWLKNLFNKRKA